MRALQSPHLSILSQPRLGLNCLLPEYGDDGGVRDDNASGSCFMMSMLEMFMMLIAEGTMESMRMLLGSLVQNNKILYPQLFVWGLKSMCDVNLEELCHRQGDSRESRDVIIEEGGFRSCFPYSPVRIMMIVLFMMIFNL